MSVATILLIRKFTPTFCLALIVQLPWAIPAYANTPTCVSSASDPDGDGWGWEQNQSCLVPVTSTVTSDSTVPACSLSSSDPDGDGWGWENSASCRIVATSVDDTSTAAPSVPVCVSNLSDTDGDGWGWENESSCRVSATDPTVPVASPQPVKIMAVGDSITQGYKAQGSSQSYRKPLTEFLNGAGCDYEMVGSRSQTHRPSGFTSPHESYSGHRVDSFLEGFNENRGISVAVSQYQPDVLLVHLGSNDIFLNQPVTGAYKLGGNAGTISEIKELVAAAISTKGDVRILLANVIPWYGVSAHNPDVSTDITALGDQIEQYVQSIGNPMVQLVDVRSGYTADMMYSDGVHPNSKGENHLADAFLAVLAPGSVCP